MHRHLHPMLAAILLPGFILSCTPTSQGLPPPVANQAPAGEQGSSVPPPFPITFEPMPTSSSPALLSEARALTQRFVGTLLPTLQQAMEQGGPLNAIEVCAVEAPAIAQRLSEESGWQVTRVSLKARNPSTATPDFWETQILNMFDQRQRAGESGADLNVGEIMNGQFRYMQAQPTAPLCLSCHGSEVAGEVLSAIRRQYPNDLAIGYQLGEIRGAISLQKEM